MSTHEISFKLDLDTADAERKLKRLTRQVRRVTLAAHLALAVTFAGALVLGMALGMAVAR